MKSHQFDWPHFLLRAVVFPLAAMLVPGIVPASAEHSSPQEVRPAARSVSLHADKSLGNVIRTDEVFDGMHTDCGTIAA